MLFRSVSFKSVRFNPLRAWSMFISLAHTSDRPGMFPTHFCPPNDPLLNLFRTELQHVTSDGPGQDAGDRVNHLHPDLITRRRPEHHAKPRERFLHQPPLQQRLFVVSHPSPGSGNDQLQRRQLLHLRHEVFKVSPRTGTVPLLRVSETDKDRSQQRRCDCEHSDNRNSGSFYLWNAVEKDCMDSIQRNKDVFRESKSLSQVRFTQTGRQTIGL